MRTAEVQRTTNETNIKVSIDLDGTGKHQIDTGIGFLDHMLSQIAAHGLFDLTINAEGDLHIDTHHTVEDVALTLGAAIDQALGLREGIFRMGHAYVPMDETLGFVAIDLSGRPYSVSEVEWTGSVLGGIATTLFPHFFQSLATTLRANLHTRILYGADDHHKAEALFKAFGRALDGATQIDPRRADQIPSTKGQL